MPARAAHPSGRRLSWDLVRVAAVLSVVLGHVMGAGPVIHEELGGFPFRYTVQSGATSLMVISAYFVCVTIRRGRPGHWLRNRLARLLPAYLVSVLLTYAITRFAVAGFNGLRFAGGPLDVLFGDPVAAQPEPGGPPAWYLPNVLDLLGSLTMLAPFSVESRWVDPSYWTMPVQVLAFVVAALLWPRRWRRGAALVVLLWSVIIVPYVLGVVLAIQEVAPDWATGIFYGFGMPRARLFAAGVGIWLWSRRRISGPHLAFMLASVVFAEYVRGADTHLPSMLVFVAMVGLIALAAGGPDWKLPLIGRFARQISWLAGVSFGVYLVQQQLGYVLARMLVDAGFGPGARLITVLGAAVLGGWLLTALVERPMHQWLMARRRPSAGTAGESSAGSPHGSGASQGSRTGVVAGATGSVRTGPEEEFGKSGRPQGMPRSR